MRYAAMFLWLALPIAAYATYATHGLPHFIPAALTIDLYAPTSAFRLK